MPLQRNHAPYSGVSFTPVLPTLPLPLANGAEEFPVPAPSPPTCSTSTQPSPHPFLPPFMGKEYLGIGPLSTNPYSSILGPYVQYDVRYPASNAVLSASGRRLHRDELKAPATMPTARRIRIISRGFPWEIKISNFLWTLTYEDVLDAVFDFLRRPITTAEWRSLDEETRKKVIVAMGRNCALQNSKRKARKGILRVDLLLENTVFVRLEKDYPYITEYSPRMRTDVWVLVLGKQR